LSIAIGNISDTYFTVKAQKIEKAECQTCSNRRYQDASNDPGVSFKTPGKIYPKVSGSVVMSHEQEHVRSEAANAVAENKKIVSQSVRLQTSICPECGTSYVSGGTTTTVTRAENNNERKDYFFTNYNNIVAQNFGMIVDVRV
jgi:ribosomal protein S27AE